MDIKILEQVCWGGSKVAPIVDEALTELNLDDDFEIVSDLGAILEYEVSKLPALVIDGEVKLEGTVPSIEEVKKYLK